MQAIQMLHSPKAHFLIEGGNIVDSENLQLNEAFSFAVHRNNGMWSTLR